MKNFIGIILLFASVNTFSQKYTPKQYKEDFTFFWNTVDSNYCYFEKKHIDWNSLKSIYSKQVDTVSSRNGFISILERAIYELYDHHCGLNTRTNLSRRLVPTGADIWAGLINDKAIITEVRRNFGAERAGIRAGMEVVAINGIPVKEAIRTFLPHTINNESQSFALRLLLAGDHITKRIITIKIKNTTKDYYPDKDSLMLEHITYPAMVESKEIGQIGYIRINNYLFDNAIIAQFDSVLNRLLNKRSIIIDLRETPSGGNTSVARAILGRFINKEKFYQKHELYAEEKETGIKRSWVEIVSPRGTPYLKPVVILADHWTGSISEGITIAFDSMQRATVIGTSLARLNGAVTSFEMPNTKIRFNISAEKLYHVNGLPRELYMPKILVNVTNGSEGNNGDLILNSALSFLKNK